MIVGIDPRTFHPDYQINTQVRFLPEYTKHFIQNPSLFVLKERVLRLLTIEQTIASFRSIFKIAGLYSPPEIVRYRPDGRAEYIEWDGQIADGKFDLGKILKTYNPKFVDDFRIDTFTSLSEERRKNFEKLLLICADKDIQVYCFMPPLHPSLLSDLNEHGAEKIYSMVREYLSEQFNIQGGVFRDYTRIESFNGNPDEFYDGVHMRESNGNLLIYDLFSMYDSDSNTEETN